MKKNQKSVALEPVEPLILAVRGEKVILDVDLARIYGVPTKRLNEQVKAQCGAFPRGFSISPDRRRSEGVAAFKVANCDLEARAEYQVSAVRLHRTWRHHGRQRSEQSAGRGNLKSEIGNLELSEAWCPPPQPEKPRRRIGFNQDVYEGGNF